MNYNAAWLASLPEARRNEVLGALPRDVRGRLLWVWKFWAREDQLAPEGKWVSWLLLGGRGAGKTRTGAEWVRASIAGKTPLSRGRRARIAMVGDSDVAKAPLGARTMFRILEESHTLALAATSDTAIQIPDRAIVFGVTVRVQTAITGATSYNCGIVGDLSKYGGTLGIAGGSSNLGVTGPTAFYANTPVRFSAVGGNFTGGVIRVAIHYLILTASS